MFTWQSAEEGGKEKDLHVCAPTSSRQSSRLGNNPFWSLMMPRLRLLEKNNSGLIIEDQLDGTVPHSGGSSCVAPSMSCRGIAEKMNRRLVRRERVKSRHGALRTGVGSSLACVSDPVPWAGIWGAVPAHGVFCGRPF